MDKPNTLEGSIHLDLAMEGGRIKSVQIQSTRPVQACSVLDGKPVEEAIGRLGLMFSMCGTAHTVAGLRAAERALGITASEKEDLCRDLLVLAEAAEQTGLRILLDWPGMLGDKAAIGDVISLRSVLHLMPGLITSVAGWKKPGSNSMKPDTAALDKAVDRLENEIANAMLGGDNDEKIFSSFQDLKFWWETADVPTAKLLRAVHQEGLSSFGASETELLKELDESWLEKKMASDDGAFVAGPDLNGEMLEAGPLRTLSGDSLIQSLTKEFGQGLLVRLLARVIFMIRLPRRMRAIIGRLEKLDDGCVATGEASGFGLAQIDTARGLLVHRVEIDEGKIKRYQTLAPTEWNFHREGPLFKGLMGAEVKDEDEMRKKASLMMMALDPCVAFDISVAGEG